MRRPTIQSMAIQPKLNRSGGSMGLRLYCATTSTSTPLSNCNMTARVREGGRPSMAEAGSLTSLSEENPVMKRAQFLLLAAAVIVAGSSILLRKATAAGGEVDIIVNKANTVDDLPL